MSLGEMGEVLVRLALALAVLLGAGWVANRLTRDEEEDDR